MEAVLTKVGFIGFTTLVAFILGTILGSFVKALADRSLTKESFWGRSYCPNCKKGLRWYDLLPVLSYIILSGKCRYCHKRIGGEYLVVEVVMGLLIGFLFWQSLQNIQFPISNFQLFFKLPSAEQIASIELIFKTFFITILAVLFLTDLRKMLIPDRIIIPSIIVAFIFLLILTIYKIGFLYYYLVSHPIGKYLLPPQSSYFQSHAIVHLQSFALAVISGLILGGFFLLLIIITRGKGMGGGDVKLGAFMGLGLGFPNILVAVMSAFVIGALFSVSLIIFGKKGFRSIIPFGPFLVVGSLLALFWGDQIINWYLNLSTLGLDTISFMIVS